VPITIIPKLETTKFVAKSIKTSYSLLYDADPNLPLPTTEPTEPTLSVPVTLPSITGDPVTKVRYALVVALNCQNTATSPATVYIRVVAGNRTFYFEGTRGNGIVGTHYAVLHDVLANTVDIYAWASLSGVYLRRSIVFMLAVPVISPNFAEMIFVRVDGLKLHQQHHTLTSHSHKLCCVMMT
jgi:hypothetical protein